MVYLDVKAQCNACGDAGARALCSMLIELREANVAAVRAIHLWKNELGDEGACAVADLVASSSVAGAERFWVAEVKMDKLYLYVLIVCVYNMVFSGHRVTARGMLHQFSHAFFPMTTILVHF